MTPNETKLLSMLSNNDVTFFIPPYQRNYEWDSEQCEAFLSDIIKTAKNNISGEHTEHFFGFITYAQYEHVFGQPDTLVLIDGQQRITTTMLFLTALRDLSDDLSLRSFIENKYLKNQASDENKYKIKLKQVETDWESYKKIILSEDLTSEEKNSAVYRNYLYFKNKILSLEEAGEDVNSLINNGLDQFSVITVELQPDKNKWENPQEIFESMNSLGKPLSLADLVRNYLLLGLSAKKQTEYYNRYWLKIEKVLGNNISDYIRDFMQWETRSACKKATESNYKELYSQFKVIFINYSSEDILSKLCAASEIYASILPGGETGIEKIDKILKDLQTLKVTTAYSFMLALLYDWKQQKLSDFDIVNILDAFRIYILRRRILHLTQAENKVFPQFVNYISELEKSVEKRKAMFDILSKQESALRLPNDLELTRALESMNFYNFSYCKLYLAMMEEAITKNRPDLSDSNLQIEHIMPQTLNDKWTEALGNDAETAHQEYVNNLGNLTLIRHNQELGQRPFREKKEIYENNAGLQIAKNYITSEHRWNINTIKKRNKWATELLLNKVLEVPDDKKQRNNFSVKASHGLSFVDLHLVGEYITFIFDNSIRAKVVDDKEVEFDGKKWRLSPLTREIMTRRGQCNASGAYQGAQYWCYDDIKLADII